MRVQDPCPRKVLPDTRSNGQLSVKRHQCDGLIVIAHRIVYLLIHQHVHQILNGQIGIVLHLPFALITQGTEIQIVLIFRRRIDNMRHGIVRTVFLAHNQYRICISHRIGKSDIVRHIIGLVKVETDDVILIGQSNGEHLVRIRLDGDIDRMVQILLQLFQDVILETDDRTLIHEIVGGMVKQAHRERIAMLYVLLFLQFWNMYFRNEPSMRKHTNGK